MMQSRIPSKLSFAAVAWCAMMAMTVAMTVAMTTATTAAWAAAYRCEVDGKTFYGDQPCNVGRQSEVAVDSQGPSAADRAAAAARLRNDKAAATVMQREREKRERVERVPTRAGSEYGKQVRACTKLAVRARRAHEDYAAAGPRDQPKKRVRMLRAEEDHAMLCSKR